MSGTENRRLFFAGGGTGGHLYPAMAVAALIQKQKPETEITFFCSRREIDAKILGPSGFDFLPLPAEGFSISPTQCIRFLAQFVKSYYFSKQILSSQCDQEVVMGAGGFVSAPVILAARSLGIPVCLLNVDSVPGKANRLLGRLAKIIFVQFEQTKSYFAKAPGKVIVSGCPLREEFQTAKPDAVAAMYGLDREKKILLITGASSGSLSINRAFLEILPDLERFSDQWQIVHLTGTAHFETVRRSAVKSAIRYVPVEYCHEMPALLNAADLVVGRAGAVSMAEYAAAGAPAICLPYPYHKDRHQFLNAQPMAEAGAAVIVEDQVKNPKKTAAVLLQVLSEIMENTERLSSMKKAAAAQSHLNAASVVANALMNLQ